MTSVNGMVARVIAAGMLERGRARAVIMLLPRRDSDEDMRDWPTVAHGLLDSVTAIQASPPNSTDKQPWPVVMAQRSEAERAARGRAIVEAATIWRQVIPINGDWAAVRKAWKGTVATTTNAPTLFLPTAEAGLALPLERAREALEALAPPDSPLFARSAPRPPPQSLSALGRPWLGQPDALAQFSALHTGVMSDAARRALIGPPDVGEWLREPNPLEGSSRGDAEDPYGADLVPDAMAAAALGLHGADMLGTFDRMFALHHHAMTLLAQVDAPSPAQSAPPAPSAPLDSTGAERRVAQLMASSLLLRLFGLARDVVLQLPEDAEARRYWTLSGLVAGHATPIVAPTAVKRVPRDGDDPGCFYPPPRAEWTAAKPVADAWEEDGIARLGVKDRFALISLEPALALESRIRHDQTQIQKAAPNVKEPATPPPTVRTDGLSLVQLGRLPDALPSPSDGPECAEELRAFDRLDVGVVLDARETPTASHGTMNMPTAWHGTMNRNLLWQEPGGAEGGINSLARMLSPTDIPDWELQAAALTLAKIVPDTEPTVALCDRRLATWTGEPGGVPINQPWWDGETLKGNAIPINGERFRWGSKPVEVHGERALPLGQKASLPVEAGTTLLPLRFGWRYRVGLRRVFIGGVAVPLSDAVRRYEQGAFALPARADKGRRFLRHEPVDAPLVFLAPGTPLPGATHESHLQSPTKAVIVSWPAAPPAGHAAIASTARVLLVPPVSLEFAMLHEVFDGIANGMRSSIDLAVPRDPGETLDSADRLARPANTTIETPPPVIRDLDIRPPPDGLHRLDLSGISATQPSANPLPLRLLPPEIGRKRTVLYYPDPAAATLVLRLRHPSKPDVWLSPPLAIKVRGEGGAPGTWPNSLPVQVLLETRRAGELSLSAASAPQALHPPSAQLFWPVRARLAPGEAAILVAWLCPSIADLAAWFDLCDSMRVLGGVEGAALGEAPAKACAAGLDALLGACTVAGAGGDAEAADLQRLATLLHDRLMEQPFPLISAPARIELTHAVPHVAKTIEISPSYPIVVARRSSAEPADLRSFLGENGHTPDWHTTASEDGGDEAVFGGEITLDLAAASGFILEAELAAPGDQPLDPPPPAISPNLVPVDPPPVPFVVMQDPERIVFNPGRVEVLRIDGLPQPDELGAPATPLRLEELQRKWLHERDGELQISRASPAKGGSARFMTMRLRPIPRHTALLTPPPPARLVAPSSTQMPPELIPPNVAMPYSHTQPCVLPATVAPTALDIKELLPTFDWTRPPEARPDGAGFWQSDRRSGLRLVARRPGFSSGEGEQWGIVFATLSGDLERTGNEEDLGTIGRWVSAWGLDPIRNLPTVTPASSIFLRPEHIPNHPANGFRLHPTVPLPLQEPLPKGLDLSMLAAQPRFQPAIGPRDPGHWYLDVPLDLPGSDSPFIRLGVVRYQPHARPDHALHKAAMAPPSIRFSVPAAAWSQLPPRRQTRVFAAHSLIGDGAADISIVVTGPGAPRNRAAHPLLPDTSFEIRLVEAYGDHERLLEDVTGQPCIARSSSPPSDAALMQRQIAPIHVDASGTTRSAAFRIPGPVPPQGRRLAVIVEECDRMPDANGPDELQPGQSRPSLDASTRYFCRIDLR